MTDNISNSDDIINSHDIIDRIEELQAMKAAFEAAEEAIVWTEDEEDELKALLALQDEAEGYCPDWNYGATLIRDSYFRQYAQDLADDIGAIDRNATWPLTHIDWDAAADDLKQDYISVDFDGETYWVR